MFQNKSFYICATGISKSRLTIFRKNIECEKGNILNTLDDTSIKTDIVLLDDSIKREQIPKILDIAKAGDAIFVRVPWLSQCIKAKKLVALDAFKIDVKDLIEANSSQRINRKRRTADVTETDISAGDSNDVSTSTKSPSKKSKFACDTSSKQPIQRNVNDLICEKLHILATGYRSTNDKWRALSYEKAINAIKNHPEPITTYKQAKSIKGIGDRLAKKIEEIATSGELRKAQEFQNDAKIQSLNLFNNIWGVGPTTAEKFYSLGFKTLDDLRENESKANLTRQQKIGLKHYDDLLERIPRLEADKIVEIVQNIVADIDPNLICIVCGSYRRGRETVGDLDFLITCKSDRTSEGSLAKIVQRLTIEGYLTDHLIESSVEQTHRKYMGIIKLKGAEHKHRRIDIIEVPYDEFATSLIYFTGSEYFTRSIYAKAKSMGWRLNQHGLRKSVIRKKGEVVHEGVLFPTPTEESVFEALGMKYLTPEERDHV